MASSADEEYEYEYSEDEGYPVSDDDEMEWDATAGGNPNAAPMTWSKTAATINGE